MAEKLTTYIVKDGKTVRLVQAANKVQVRAHLLHPVSIEYAEQSDLIAALTNGIDVETVSTDSEAA